MISSVVPQEGNVPQAQLPEEMHWPNAPLILPPVEPLPEVDENFSVKQLVDGEIGLSKSQEIEVICYGYFNEAQKTALLDFLIYYNVTSIHVIHFDFSSQISRAICDEQCNLRYFKLERIEDIGVAAIAEAFRSKHCKIEDFMLKGNQDPISLKTELSLQMAGVRHFLPILSPSIVLSSKTRFREFAISGNFNFNEDRTLVREHNSQISFIKSMLLFGYAQFCNDDTIPIRKVPTEIKKELKKFLLG